MRLVSVVVPLWLTATASVSLMSSCRPKPDSSVAVIASTASVAASSCAEHHGHRTTGDRGRALADDLDPLERAGGEPFGDARAAGPAIPTTARNMAAVVGDLAPQRLGEALGRLGDLLEQEVRGVAAVDVAGRDLGDGDVVGVDRQRRAVVAEAGDPFERAGAGGVEGDELAAALAVEANVAIRLLDDAVGLAGDDETVLGDADVDALAAAAQGQHARRRDAWRCTAPIATEPSKLATVRRTPRRWQRRPRRWSSSGGRRAPG